MIIPPIHNGNISQFKLVLILNHEIKYYQIASGQLNYLIIKNIHSNSA